jgi:hypothetical protein
MARVAPFHSKKKTSVYHECSNCTEGNNIETADKVAGKGSGSLCSHCERLINSGGC